ncbi:hypothetical protein Golax_015271 [Gossypium laxum]|uniref:Uncharacterized protein n=1 Tax=Gossypium laxum TaxID=34288 RepID=A0A7J8ZXB8_9ROSI|nr:hypothetical protein [Gossypium laxum]
MVGMMLWWMTVMTVEMVVLAAEMEESLSVRFRARFASKRLLIMGIGRGLSFNAVISFIWIVLVQPSM